MKHFAVVSLFFLLALLVTTPDARLRNPWVLGDHDLNIWSVTKTTTTHDNCPEFPAFNAANPDAFFKAWHDSICCGEHRCSQTGAVYVEWAGLCNFAIKNEYYFHSGSDYIEDPLTITGNYQRVCDPMKYWNVFCYGYCLFYGAAACNFYQTLGYEARQWNLANGGHRVCDTYYNGGWHYFDWDEGGWGADASGNSYGLDYATTHASTWDQVPVKSQYFWSYGSDLSGVKNLLNQPSYLFMGSDHGGGADMSFCLRIGEKMERFFQPLNASYLQPNASLPSGTPQPFGNARITYNPQLQSGYADYLDGIYEQSNATLEADGVNLANGYVTWAIRSPYCIYNSTVTVGSTGSLATEISFDLGKTWVTYTSATQAQQYYSYLLKVSGTGKINTLNVVTIGQCNPGALPKLHSGSNNVRFALYENDETLALLPDWRTSTGFNTHVVATQGFSYSAANTYGKNGGQTRGGSHGSYLTIELTGPSTGKVVSASGNFLASRTKNASFETLARNTFQFKTGNSTSNLVTRTIVPPHISTTVATMSDSRFSEYGFGWWGHALNFERDSIENPSNVGYVQCYNGGQYANLRECELYMHYYVNHLAADYLNDLRICHVYNRSSGGTDSIVQNISAEDIASGNGVVNYIADVSSPLPQDPNYSISMSVASGVLLTDLQNKPTLSARNTGTVASQGIALEQNIPNPFNPATAVTFSISGKMEKTVHLAVYNLKGELIKVLTHGTFKAGAYTAEWNGTDQKELNVSGGVYICKLTAGNTVLTRKMILAR